MEKIRSCRLCSVEHIKNQGVRNLFTKKGTELTLSQRLEEIDVVLVQNATYSSTICQSCFRAFEKMAQLLKLREKWISLNEVNTQEEFNYTTKDCKRLLSPSSRITEVNKRQKISEFTVPSSKAKRNISSQFDNLDTEKSNEKVHKFPLSTAKDEIKSLTRLSIITNTEVNNIVDFDALLLCKTVELNCPIIASTVCGAMDVAIGSSEKVYARAQCYGLMFKARYPNNQPCVVTHRNDQLMIAAGLKRSYFKIFMQAGICNSYRTAMRKNKQFTENFDGEVIMWKQEREKHHAELEIVSTMSSVALQKHQKQIKIMIDKYTENINPYKTISLFDLSPSDSYLEQINQSIIEFNVKEFKNEIQELCPNFTDEIFRDVATMVNATKKVSTVDAIQELLTESKLQKDHLTDYQIVGDNLDFRLTSRHQGRQHTNKDIHWFHVMAVKHRLESHQDPKGTDQYKNITILPDENCQNMVTRDRIVLISRVLVTYFKAFAPLAKAVTWHIPHQFSKEMSEKSEVIPLGLIFKSENIAAEMVDILQEIQEKWIPHKKTVIDGETVDDVLHSVNFGGDQLTEERAINVQKAFLDGDFDAEKLLGPDPKHEDWHAKVTLYEVKEKIFGNSRSGGEFGTSEWSMNVLGTTNAKKGPHECYNAYREFCDKELDAHILAAAMEHFGMTNVEDNPIPPDVLNGTKELQNSWLSTQAREILEKFCTNYNDPEFQIINRKQKSKVDSELNINGITYPCRFAGCQKLYKRKKCRKTHELKVHNENYEIDTDVASSDVLKKEENHPTEDHVNKYAKACLTFNLFLREMNDAIREGDGGRVIELYKIALLYFKCYHHTKYAFTVLKLLVRIQCRPEKAFHLIWQRFVNTSGKKGRNISLDLHLEHLNNFLKEQLKNLRSNLNEENAKRISQSMSSMHKLVKNARNQDDVYNYHKTPKQVSDVMKLCNELKKINVFKVINGREHPSFPRFTDNLFSTMDTTKLNSWIHEKTVEFEKLYEHA